MAPGVPSEGGHGADGQPPTTGSHVLIHVDGHGGTISSRPSLEPRASLEHPQIMRHSHDVFVSGGGASVVLTGQAAIDAEREAREKEEREQRRALVRARWAQAISRAVKVCS